MSARELVGGLEEKHQLCADGGAEEGEALVDLMEHLCSAQLVRRMGVGAQKRTQAAVHDGCGGIRVRKNGSDLRLLGEIDGKGVLALSRWEKSDQFFHPKMEILRLFILYQMEQN